jgi:hypothetical protein
MSQEKLGEDVRSAPVCTLHDERCRRRVVSAIPPPLMSTPWLRGCTPALRHLDGFHFATMHSKTCSSGSSPARGTVLVDSKPAVLSIARVGDLGPYMLRFSPELGRPPF